MGGLAGSQSFYHTLVKMIKQCALVFGRSTNRNIHPYCLRGIWILICCENKKWIMFYNLHTKLWVKRDPQILRPLESVVKFKSQFQLQLTWKRLSQNYTWYSHPSGNQTGNKVLFKMHLGLENKRGRQKVGLHHRRDVMKKKLSSRKEHKVT